MHEVSRTLKDLARISSLPAAADFRPAHLGRKLARATAATEILRAEKRLRIETEVAANLPTIHGVPAQLETLRKWKDAGLKP